MIIIRHYRVEPRTQVLHSKARSTKLVLVLESVECGVMFPSSDHRRIFSVNFNSVIEAISVNDAVSSSNDIVQTLT